MTLPEQHETESFAKKKQGKIRFITLTIAYNNNNK